MKYDVLIVSYNTCADTLACLSSLVGSGAPAESIYVADNGSLDGTPEQVSARYPGVHLAAWDSNLYYAAALNRLIARSDAPYVLLLNPDVQCDMNRLMRLCHRFESDSGLAAVAPQLRFPDGRVQASCRRLPDAATPWREILRRLVPTGSHWKMDDFDHRSDARVEQPMFSCIWIRRSALARVGALDESYPLFFNDVDWCKRVRDAGMNILFDPAVAVLHRHGGTTRRYPLRKLWHAHRSFARYIRRHSGIPAGLLGNLGIWLSFLARLPGAAVSKRG